MARNLIYNSRKRTPRVGNVITLTLLYMKKLAILVVLFLGGITAQANVTNLDHNTNRGIRYNNSQPITFVQKGVTFFVNTNGSFDFNFSRGTIRGRRGNSLNAPGHTYGVTYPYRNVRYDRRGNIVKIGRNFITYNRNGLVNQIGNVSLRYHRGKLVRIGNMRIFYNKRGRIHQVRGNVLPHSGRITSVNTPRERIR